VLTSDPAIGWVAEGGTIPAADPGLGAGTAIPHKLSVRIEYSNELAEDSSPGVEQILRSVLVQRAAISVDVAAFEGSGVSPVPLGMGNVSGIGNVSAATAGTSIAWASAAAAALEASYAPPPIRVGAGHRDGQEPAGCQGRVLG
jgi:HK97 family phage major capsid protein